MKTDKDYIQFDEQVECYLRHRMTAEEERAFKQLLSEDAELKDRARFTALMIREMRSAVKDNASEGEKIIHAVKGMSEEQFRGAAGLQPKAKTIRLWPRIMKFAVAACVVGIISMVGLRQYDAAQYKAIGADPVFSSYEPMLGEAGHERGAGEASSIPQKDELLALFADIEQGKDLKTATRQLKTFYDQAKTLGSESALVEYQDDLAWYLSVAYLKLGKGREAIPLLEDIIHRGDPVNTAIAQKLLERIKDV